MKIIKGKSAKKFHKEVNDGKVSKKQKKFVNKCAKLLKTTKKEPKCTFDDRDYRVEKY